MNTIKKTFPVTGMHCAACAITVEKTLKSQKGVSNAGVNYANAAALVEYDSETANLNDIKKAVESAGYDLLIADNDNDAEKIEALNREYYLTLRIKTVFAIVLSVPIVVLGMFATKV